MFDRSKPVDADLFESSAVNHWAWSSLVLALGFIVWLCIALVNAENQRNAVMRNLCPDPLFKGALDARCLATVQSRQHWWQHVSYALTHLRS